MLEHPSLFASYSGPPARRARATMGRNEPCWCGSEIKWKKCHAGREAMEPMQVFDVEADLRRRGKKGYCSHAFNGVGCSNRVVRSHTVQRNGGLATIAEGKSRVITVKPQNLRAMIDHGGRPPPTEIGIGDASVFPGFCGYHDQSIFKPIEGGDVVPTAKEALLFAYRAIAYERFNKAVQVANAPAQRQMDRGQPLSIQEKVQTYCHLVETGARRALREVEATLADYRERVETGNTTDFHHRAYRFDEVLPLVGCGGFLPELSIDGRRLQHLARGAGPFEHLTLTITSYASRTVAVFAWAGPAEGPAGTYVSAFDALPDADKADALVQVAFEQMENIFLRISWWRSLPNAQRADLTRRIYSGVGANSHLPGYYKRNSPLLASAAVVETVQS